LSDRCGTRPSSTTTATPSTSSSPSTATTAPAPPTPSHAAAHKLKKLLEIKYNDTVKWEDEHGDTLGFAVTKTVNDAAYKPTVPYTKDFADLKPAEIPELYSIDWYAFDTRVHFMQEAGGHIAHIVKVRPDVAGAYNMVVRTSHAPCPLAPKCLKHLIFYLAAHDRRRPHHPARRMRRAPSHQNASST
jgi:hypothetical protein